MDSAMGLSPTIRRLPGGIHWLALLALTLSGCAGWQLSEIPEPAPPAAPQEPFALNTFEIDAGTEIVGRIYYTRVQNEETLRDIARAYDLGYDDIAAANPGLDPWTPDEGERVILPLAHVLPDAPREGIVINLAARRLFYFPPAAEGEPQQVVTHPIGIGREGWSTPLGKTEVAQKHVSPPWTVPASIRRERAAEGDPLPAVVPPGPDNPLGSHALRLGWSSILIHGTNKPAGIGMRVSHGCIQLYPEDIVTLFADVPVGTPVMVVDQPDLVRVGPYTGTPVADSDLADLPAAPLLTAPDPAPIPENGDWYVDLGNFEDERAARRLVAMLVYQGPPIPAQRIEQGGHYQVLAGPYLSRTAAVAVAKRIKRDLDETGKAVKLPQLANAS